MLQIEMSKTGDTQREEAIVGPAIEQPLGDGVPDLFAHLGTHLGRRGEIVEQRQQTRARDATVIVGESFKHNLHRLKTKN